MNDRFWHIGINVTDIDRSIDFYQKVGFKLVQDHIVDNPATGQALLVPGGKRLRFAHLRMNEVEEEAMLDLIQWLEPATGGRADPSMRDAGLCRFSILTDAIDERYATLTAAGVDVVQPPETVLASDGNSGWRIMFVRDPDGTLMHFVELIGAG